jgi:hypothetical protein
MTVGELGDRMDAAELIGWHDYDSRKEHSDGWLQTAAIIAALHNVMQTGKNARRYAASDFLPRRRGPVDPDRLKAKFAAFRDRHNAAVSLEGPP